MSDHPVTETVAGAVDTAASPVIPAAVEDTADTHTDAATEPVDAVQDVEERIADAVRAAVGEHVAIHHAPPVQDDGDPEESPVRKPWTHWGSHDGDRS